MLPIFIGGVDMGIFDFFKKKHEQQESMEQTGLEQLAEPHIEKVDDKDINPLNINDLIDLYENTQPDATEENVLAFVAKLAEPEEDQEHLTEDGDLPWGWHTTFEKDIKRIENKYKKFWSAWFDSRLKSPNDQLSALEAFVDCMVKTKKLCEKKSECFVYWREELFTDDYLQKMSSELNDLKANVEELQAAFEAKQNFELYELPKLENNLLQIVSSSPGILQKDIYKLFIPEAKSYIQEKLYNLAKANKIIREKCGSSYKLFVK